MKICAATIFSAAALCVLTGCFNPVLNMGDKILPVKTVKGIRFVSARSPLIKAIHYSTFGFDWYETDGFLIPREANNVNNALWLSNLTRAEKLYSVLFTASKSRHYIKTPEIKLLQTYLTDACREVPNSKIKRTPLQIEPRLFKGIPAVYVYLETFEEGRDLYLREESYYFFDPLTPDTQLYRIRWSERGKKSDWKSPQAEIQGRCFFERFKLLSVKK